MLGSKHTTLYSPPNFFLMEIIQNRIYHNCQVYRAQAIAGTTERLFVKNSHRNET